MENGTAGTGITLEELLGALPVARFIAEHLHCLPLAVPGTAAKMAPLGSWQTLDQILERSDADILLVRDGVVYDGDRPANAVAAQALSAEGWTIRVRDAQRQIPAIADLAGEFERSLRGPVNVHMYFTPAGRHGLSWHYDAEEVFILQTAGEKEYMIRKNTVHPWPLEETIPADMRYERELMPLSRVVLASGDLLYIPCGYWHRTQSPTALSETAISLAIGVMRPAAIDALAMLRERLVDSLLWRQRLPVGVEEDLEERCRLLLEQLAADASRTLKDPASLRALVDSLRNG